MPLSAEQQRERRSNKRAADEAQGVFRRKRGRLPAGHVWDEEAGAAVLEHVGTEGPGLPHYLLDRADEHSASDDEHERAIEREHREQMEQRIAAWKVWQAEHGAEREAQLATIGEAQPPFYWALSVPRPPDKPKWQLRKFECLAEDRGCALGREYVLNFEEPTLLYREFHPFEGDVLAATRFFQDPSDREWLRGERARLEAKPPTEQPNANVPPTAREHAPLVPELAAYHQEWDRRHDYDPYDAELPLPPPPKESYQKLVQDLLMKGRNGPIRLRRHPPCDPLDRPPITWPLPAPGSVHADDWVELERDLELEEQGRIAMAHGRQWDRVSGMTAPRHWLDFVDRPWERVLRERERQAEQELLDRLERMARSNVPPPLRNEERYGSRADNPAGDEAFRKDRLVWYEHVTGESLGHLTLSEQWQLVHVVARRFREYSDGRAARAREEMPPQGAPPMPQPPPAAATSAALPVPAVRLQQAPQKAAVSPHVSPWQRKLQELSPSELQAERLSLQSKLDAFLAEKA